MRRKRRVCRNCQYHREAAEMGGWIVGEHDRWCSNSLSRLFQTTMADDDHCSAFYLRGGKAPRLLRWLNHKGRGRDKKTNRENAKKGGWPKGRKRKPAK